MITLDAEKVERIKAERLARMARPEQSTHTIERIIEREVAVPAPQPVQPLDWSIKDAMRSVEDQEALDRASLIPPVDDQNMSEFARRFAPPTQASSTPEPDPDLQLAPDEILSAAVGSAISSASDNQRRYELAVQARNGNTEAMSLIDLEAQEREISINAMVQMIIDERAECVSRTMAIIAAEVRWRKAIANASDDDQAIQVARNAAAEIATL